MKEKTALTERLKTVEDSKKKLEEEVKRLNVENATKDEAKQSLEAGVKKLTESFKLSENEIKEKEDKVKFKQLLLSKDYLKTFNIAFLGQAT